jgi:NAD-dependent deacetylase
MASRVSKQSIYLSMRVEEQIQRTVEILSGSSHAIALTGAGISTPSGIPDFRSPTSGLWKNYNPFEVASIASFRQQPQDFYDWIHPIAKLVMEAEPNLAHLALAQLEDQGYLKSIITQNVDMLHNRAGSGIVLEVHGHLREATCIRCFTVYPAKPLWSQFIDTGDIPHCQGCGGVLKPNVILIGEQLPVTVMNQAKNQVRICDMMIVVGSSLEMAPAGDLPSMAIETGARLVIINQSSTYIDGRADVVIRGDVVDILPRIVESLINL